MWYLLGHVAGMMMQCRIVVCLTQAQSEMSEMWSVFQGAEIAYRCILFIGPNCISRCRYQHQFFYWRSRDLWGSWSPTSMPTFPQQADVTQIHFFAYMRPIQSTFSMAVWSAQFWSFHSRKNLICATSIHSTKSDTYSIVFKAAIVQTVMLHFI